MSADRTLPPGWAKTTLGKCCHVEMGQSPPSSSYNLDGNGLPFFQGKAEFGDLYPETRKWCEKPGKVAHQDDVLLSVRAPVGPTNLAATECCIGRGLAALAPRVGIVRRFLLYQMRLLGPVLAELGTGTTFSAVTGPVVRGFPVHVAPTNEQHRIVAKMEELFSDLDAGVAALERARFNLTRYRASVLKAAVEGKLTASWREQNPNVEPASELLKRVLVERRRKWEEAELAKYEAKGKTPPKGWREKYTEPVEPNVEGLPSLPEGWCWATVDQLTDPGRGVSYGVIKLGEPTEGGVPTLRSSNVRALWLDLEYVKPVAERIARDYVRTKLEGGELVVTIRGTLGGIAVVPPECAGWNVSREVAVLPLVHADDGPGLACFIASEGIQTWIVENTRGIAYTGINLATLRMMPVPFAPAEELKEISLLVDTALSEAALVSATAERTLGRVSRLRRAVLKRAFEGNLVPQDPADEPASILLERIKAEREEAVKKSRPAKKKARAQKPESTPGKGFTLVPMAPDDPATE